LGMMTLVSVDEVDNGDVDQTEAGEEKAKVEGDNDAAGGDAWRLKRFDLLATVAVPVSLTR